MALNLEPKLTLNTSSEHDKSNPSPAEAVCDGPKTKNDRPKRKKWKLQARSVSSEGHPKEGPSVEEQGQAQNIKKKLGS